MLYEEVVEDEGEESDPESIFLATLTSKEKKKLLKKLQELEGSTSTT